MIPERYAGYDKVVTVAAANFAAVPGNKAATLAKMEANIREAASQGVDLIAFPEEALIGVEACEVCRGGAPHCAKHDALAETVPGPSTERIAELARELDIYVVFGLAERDPERSDVLYNAAAVVGPEGIQGTYRKLHLGSLPWVSEGVTFEPGKWEYMVQTTAIRAQENLCYALSSNHVGGPEAPGSYGAGELDEERTANFVGHSTIAGPSFPAFSQIYAEAGGTEELITATLSFEKLHRWESVFPWREWRATHQSGTSELIAEEFRKLAHGA